MKLYHFTRIEAFCKIWVSKKLRLSNNFNTNDLFEQRKAVPYFNTLCTSANYKNSFEAYNDFCKRYLKELSLYKQISFTMDYVTKEGQLKMEGWQSSLMWGQYAHNEQGVCIELDSELLGIDDKWRDEVKYKNIVPHLHFDNDTIVDSDESIEQFVNKNIKQIFFIKHRHWEHENEFRIIRRSTTDEYLSIENAIKAIYVFSVDGINSQIVESLVRSKVPLYALLLNDNKECNVDRVEMSRYRDAIEKKRPLMPSLDLTNVQALDLRKK